MKKIIKLTESDLNNLVEKVIKETYQNDESYLNKVREAEAFAKEIYFELINDLMNSIIPCLESMNAQQKVLDAKNKFMEKYPGIGNPRNVMNDKIVPYIYEIRNLPERVDPTIAIDGMIEHLLIDRSLPNDEWYRRRIKRSKK